MQKNMVYNIDGIEKETEHQKTKQYIRITKQNTEKRKDRERMREHYLLSSERAAALYERVRTAPIYDYHCHLSPKAIYEDKPFSDIGEMMLGGDHYKWRLMRASGIEERLITGDAPWKEKFKAYARAVSVAAGNPLYHWTEMELSLYFHIDTPLNEDTAEAIYAEANRQLRESALSPRKLISLSRVAYIATTDDPADDLVYHDLLAAEEDFTTRVTPTFRPDKLLLLRDPGFSAYMERLGGVCGYPITDLSSLDRAILDRLDYFVARGCAFSDVGIPDFPACVGGDAEADAALTAALSGETVSEAAYHAYLFRMYRFLGEAYRARDMVMQWHLGVTRNVNTRLYTSYGPDAGGDCIGDRISTRHLAAVLDAIDGRAGLPETVIYTLDPSANDALASLCYSFPHVRPGAAWWFCDHKEGIEELIRSVSRTGSLGHFLGMLTDSRSFLSYSRHDYFRRILCSLLAAWCDRGEFSGDAAGIAEAVSVGNIRTLIEKTEEKRRKAKKT